MKKIALPEELYQKLDLGDNQEVEVVEVAKDSFKIRAVRTKKGEYAANWFLVPTFLSAVLFVVLSFVFNKTAQIPLTGAMSISTSVLVIANIVGILTFTLTYINKRKELYRTITRRVYWRTFLTVIISVFLIVTLSLSALFWFLSQMFYGINFDLFTSTVFFTIFSAILNYIMIFVVDQFEVSMLLNMLIIVSVGGIISSIATSGNQYWWQRNFSELGTKNSEASVQFNLTLIVSAALMVALFDYVFVSLAEKYKNRRRYRILHTLLNLCATCVAIVGLVPNNEGLAHLIHDSFAQLIVLFMGLAILGVPWFLPHVGKNIHRISYVVAGLLALSYLLWRGPHYFTLTAFEIISFSMCFSWLLLLINNLLSLLWEDKAIYKVTITKDE